MSNRAIRGEKRVVLEDCEDVIVERGTRILVRNSHNVRVINCIDTEVVDSRVNAHGSDITLGNRNRIEVGDQPLTVVPTK